MIIYFRCLCTAADRLKAKELRSKGHTVKIANNPAVRQEVAKYNMAMPFSVFRGKAKPLQ